MTLTFTTQNAGAVVERLRSAGYTAFFAGGCVRDALLGRQVNDIDIATNALPDAIEALFPGQTVPVGKAFGVILVIQGGERFDVATFRTDGGYQDGRRPDSITFSSAEHDARRRDFTVNGLFYDPHSRKIHDYVNGLPDLDARLIRAIGDPDLRFAEDRLRMMRAIRFSATLGFTIEPATLAAIGRHAPTLAAVSIERIAGEFIRTLCEAPGKPSAALDRLFETGLLRSFFPELTALRGCLQDPVWHPEGDVWAHTTLMLDHLPAPRDPELVWAVLLHDIAKPHTLVTETKPDGSPWHRTPNHAKVGAELAETILRRFKQPLALIQRVTESVRHHMQFTELPNMQPATLRRTLGRPTIALELELHRLDCLSSHSKLDLYRLALEKRAAFQNEPILPPPLIQGRDLLAAGHTPGPRLGAILKHLYTAQLGAAFTTPEGGLAWLKNNPL